jgi:hypothetical protein
MDFCEECGNKCLGKAIFNDDDDDDGRRVAGVRMSLNCDHRQAYYTSSGGYMSMENHDRMIMSTDSSTRALWQSYQQSHLVASRRNGRNQRELGLAKYFCSYLQMIFTCCKILPRGSSIFTFRYEGRCHADLKVYRLCRV